MKKLLLIVDFQNIFADEKIGSGERDVLENKIEQVIVKYLNNDDDIAFTIDEAGYGADNAIVGKIENYLNNAVAIFRKNTYGSLEFGNWLADKSYGKVEICGLVSNMCVIANAVIAKSALPDAEIVVDSSLTASCDNELGLKALEVMKSMKMTVVYFRKEKQ